MRIATWNVNSIRARQERVLDWLQRSDTDVLAMQEVKCRPDQFPTEAFSAAGYDVAVHGLNQWNGVAIASRVGLTEVMTQFPDQPSFAKPELEPVVEARAIGAVCGGVTVWSVYVPNGRGLDDPHYTYKLEFVRGMAQAARAWAERPTALMGDWNVAPLSTDIWNEQDTEAATHVTDAARDALSSLEESGYEELSRRFVPEPHTYTFWDYKQLRFPRNEGMRIDFVYASAPLSARATAGQIVRDERKGKGASDHVPVVIDLNDAAAA